MFIDSAKLVVKSGKGGDGCISFRREKFVAKGGPNGGDGGRGGNVIARGNENMNTLIKYRTQMKIEAESGENGRGSNQTGASGAIAVVEVPLGTLIYKKDQNNNKILVADITEHNQEIVLAKGGKGGQGNTRFKSAVNRAPRKATSGKPGEEFLLELELKLMADVGLVGFPNAGKSTLISSISNAHPKIANYEFTTLQPSLGVINFDNYASFIMADIPGLIENAHEGKGLGDQFLKHIQRTKTLLYLIDINAIDHVKEYKVLRNELHSYDPYLDKKPHMIAITKLDTIPKDDRIEILNMIKKEFKTKVNETVIGISSVSRYKLQELKQNLYEQIKEEKDSNLDTI